MNDIPKLINLISNATNSNLKSVTFSWPYAKNKDNSSNNTTLNNVLNILRYSGYIRGFYFSIKSSSNITHNIKHQICIDLKYDQHGKSVINWIKLISTPSLAKYVTTKTLWQLRSNPGLSVISTSIGILTDTEARRYNVGGYLLFIIR